MSLHLFFQLYENSLLFFSLINFLNFVDLSGIFGNVFDLMFPEMMKLIDKVGIGFGSVSFLSEKFECSINGPNILVHKISAYNCSRSGNSGMTVDKNIKTLGSCFIDEVFSFGKVMGDWELKIVSDG